MRIRITSQSHDVIDDGGRLIGHLSEEYDMWTGWALVNGDPHQVGTFESASEAAVAVDEWISQRG